MQGKPRAPIFLFVAKSQCRKFRFARTSLNFRLSREIRGFSRSPLFNDAKVTRKSSIICLEKNRRLGNTMYFGKTLDSIVISHIILCFVRCYDLKIIESLRLSRSSSSVFNFFSWVNCQHFDAKCPITMSIVLYWIVFHMYKLKIVKNLQIRNIHHIY